MKMHLGANGMSHCGESHLLGATTMELGSVDCIVCLWLIMQQTLGTVDRIAFRIKMVTDEERAARVSVLQ